MRRLVLALVVIVLLVPATYYAAPQVRQWQQLRNLTAEDPGDRQRALGYVVVHMDNPAVFAGAVAALSGANEANFLQIVDALQSAGRWRRPDVPDQAYLRWLSINAESPNHEAPIRSAQRLAELPDLADDEQLITILDKLSKHDNADVRYNALCAAAALCLSAEHHEPYHDLFLRHLDDKQHVIAYHAALFAYLTDTPGVEPPAWINALPTATDRAYDEVEIRRLLTAHEAPLRDVGCVLAVRDLAPDALSVLVAELLQDPRQEAKLSGAILAGLTGEQLDLLRNILEAQSDWSTAAVMRLGLWMQRGLDAGDDLNPAALLAHGDIPRSTVILALLHRHDPLAYDVLLNPQGESPGDLVTLLEDYGWWRVLNHYPPMPAPRWRPTDVPTLRQHQVDLLRDWYVVHRHILINVTKLSRPPYRE